MIPTVSIILSTYKSEKYLEKWLESACQQSAWKESELIVAANDASETEKKLLDYFALQHKEQVKIFYVPRENLYASWNRCLKEASGKYFAIANADDIRTNNGLEIQINALENNPEYLFCYGPFTTTKEFGLSSGELVSPPLFNRDEFTRSMFLGSFFIWKRTVNPAIQYFDEQFKSGGDFDFAIRLALHGQGILVKENLGYYYNGGTGLSTGNVIQEIERTIIELRYGIFDKINYYLIPRTIKYNLPYLLQSAAWHHVNEFIPDWENFVSRQESIYFKRGIRSFIRKNGFIGKIVHRFKKVLK